MILGLEVIGWVFVGAAWFAILTVLVDHAMDGRSWRWVAAISAVIVFALPLAIIIPITEAHDAKPFDGYVYKLGYEPAHTTFIMVGKIATAQYIPPRWYMILKSTDNADARSCDISETAYREMELGSMQHCGGY